MPIALILCVFSFVFLFYSFSKCKSFALFIAKQSISIHAISLILLLFFLALFCLFHLPKIEALPSF